MVENKEELSALDELVDTISNICEMYTVAQVTSATFSVMLAAIKENEIADEQLYVLNTVMAELNHEYLRLIADTDVPEKSQLH